MRTAFLIDGFNFYHSIQDLPPHFHWIDYSKFCRHFLKSCDTIHSITYFTALAFWKPDSESRHRVFIEACKAIGINVVCGKFKEKTSNCPIKKQKNIQNCHGKIVRHEEKATDVNIALTAYRLAALEKVEQIFFVTGDTDMIPAIEMINKDFPLTNVGVIFPFNRANKELKCAVKTSYKTNIKTLEKFILPERLPKENGKMIVCPPEWSRLGTQKTP